MVLIVLLGLNGQNNDGRSLFDKGLRTEKKWGPSEQEVVCGKYESFD